LKRARTNDFRPAASTVNGNDRDDVMFFNVASSVTVYSTQ
jgi:hypothetical protein